MANPYKQGDHVRYKDTDERIFTVHTIYGDEELSLGLYDYPDTEQDSMTTVHEIESAEADYLEEQACEDMADVCELAHKRTVKTCEKLGISVDCLLPTQDGECIEHEEGSEEGDHYSNKAQIIFDLNYSEICERTGL